LLTENISKLCKDNSIVKETHYYTFLPLHKYTKQIAFTTKSN